MLNLKSIITTAYRVPLKVCLIAESSKRDMESSQALMGLGTQRWLHWLFFSPSVASEISPRESE